MMVCCKANMTSTKIINSSSYKGTRWSCTYCNPPSKCHLTNSTLNPVGLCLQVTSARQVHLVLSATLYNSLQGGKAVAMAARTDDHKGRFCMVHYHGDRPWLSRLAVRLHCQCIKHDQQKDNLTCACGLQRVCVHVHNMIGSMTPTIVCVNSAGDVFVYFVCAHAFFYSNDLIRRVEVDTTRRG